MVVPAAGAMHVAVIVAMSVHPDHGGLRRGCVGVVVCMVVFVPMPVPVARSGIGPGLRLEGLVHLADDQVHLAQQFGQHMVGLEFQVVRLQLEMHMAVAQVVGGAQQVERCAVLRAMRDPQHRLRRREHTHQRAVLGDQHVAAAHHRAARQEHADRAAARVGGVEAALLPHVPVEFDAGRALEQHGGEAAAAGDQLVHMEHGGQQSGRGH